MKASFLKIVRIGILGCLLGLICSGCTLFSKRLDRGEDYFFHQVRWPGETLSIIAKWYTDNINNWRTIAKTNPDLDPDRIVIGAKIRIKSALLTTRKPMPKSYVAEFYTRQKIKSPTPDAVTRPEPQEPSPAPASLPAAEPEKKQEPPQAEPPLETQEQRPAPASLPAAEPEKKQEPPKTVQQPKTQDKTSLPVTSSESKPEKKQLQPEGEKEPVLFGPKGYSQ